MQDRAAKYERLKALMRAAEEVKTFGTFTYAADAIPGGTISQLMSQKNCGDRR